jgi:hypothetical protein
LGVTVGSLGGLFLGVCSDGVVAGSLRRVGMTIPLSGLIMGCVFGLISTSLSIVTDPLLRFTDSLPTVI